MMNINPVNFTKINTFSPEKRLLNKTCASDVFVKRTSFKGTEVKSNNDFVNWAEETGFLNGKLEEIMSNPENKLGSGFNHSVYNIPDNDNYLLRISNSIGPFEMHYSKAKIKDTEDKNLTINIGQQVAEITVPTSFVFPETIEVIKKQKGKSLGVPPYEALSANENGDLRKGELPYEALERKLHYAESIHDVAQLPVSAYEKLISDVISANEAGYSFDYLNSNNLLVDKNDKSINLIDMNKSGGGVNLGNVLYALTNISYFSTYSSSYDENPMSEDDVNKALNDTIQIISKFMQTMQNMGLKLDKNECSYQFMNLMNSFPFTLYCKTFDFNEKWEKLKHMGFAV